MAGDSPKNDSHSIVHQKLPIQFQTLIFIKMKSIFLILLLTFSLPGKAQNFKEQFFNYLKKKDTTEAKKVATLWEAQQPNDAELYVAWFNYYTLTSMKEVVRLENKPQGDQYLTITDKDTTKKEPVGYMFSEMVYVPSILNKGFHYIDIGIQKFPLRLDMRFGKIYILGQTKDYATFTQNIITTINYASTIKNKWTWTNNEPLKDSEKFLLDAVQDYSVQLYQTGDDSLLSNMSEIAEAVLKYYPNHVQSLSNLSISYMVRGDFDRALEPLIKASKVAPKDPIVLSNIAYCYYQKGDKPKATEYYKLTAKYGEGEVQDFANQRLLELAKQ